MRFQKGQLFRTKASWFVRYYLAGRQKAERLCEATQTKDHAKREAARVMARVNAAQSRESDMPLVDFVEHHFQPYYEAKYPPSTVDGMRRYWKVYLKGALAGHTLQKFSTADGSELLTSFAKRGLGRSTLQKIRAFVRTLFSIAVSTGRVSFNPINSDCKILVPVKESAPTVEYSPKQVAGMLKALDEPRARAAIALTFYCGLRPGEARGVQWRDWNGTELKVLRSVWRTYIGKTTKTKESRKVPTIAPVPEILNALKATQPAPLPDCFILSGDVVPINLDNLSRRVIGPELRKAKIKWVGYYPGRRGISSFTTEVNNPLIASALMGHRTPSTTLKHYTRVSEKALAAGMKAVQKKLRN